MRDQIPQSYQSKQLDVYIATDAEFYRIPEENCYYTSWGLGYSEGKLVLDNSYVVPPTGTTSVEYVAPGYAFGSPSWPPVDPQGTTVKGFDYCFAVWLIRWDVTGGLVYY